MAYHNTTLKSKKKVLTLDELHLNKEVRTKIDQLIEEFAYIDALSQLDIPVDNKILLHGHTGCGKTATANAIGLALNKKVITINLSGFVSSKLGETAKNLSDLFKQASTDKAILFIDEFDFVGKLRDYDEKDSGEMKRLVNALIQQIDHLNEHTLLICATNHIAIIDTALLRRFQIKLNYELPSQESLDVYYDSILSNFPKNICNVKRSYGISYAEAKDSVLQQIKANVIHFEKQKKHLLFSYDTSKLTALQLQNNGKEPKRTKAVLSGYKLNGSDTNDPSSIEKDVTHHQVIAIKSKEKSDKIEGVVFKISGEELLQIDKQNLSNYKRVLEKTDIGTDVWVYVAHDSY